MKNHSDWIGRGFGRESEGNRREFEQNPLEYIVFIVVGNSDGIRKYLNKINGNALIPIVVVVYEQGILRNHSDGIRRGFGWESQEIQTGI